MIAMGKMKDPNPDGALAVQEQPASSPAPSQAVPAATTAHYPQGEFRINETKVVFAPAGTSLLALADQYHVSLSYLVDFNDLKNDNELAADQLVYLQRKRKVGGTPIHIVLAGECLYDIAQAEGIRLNSLLEYNQLDETMHPAPGESLYLQGKAPSRPKLVQAELVTFKTN